MKVEHKLSALELHNAYLKGQRIFKNIGLFAGTEALPISGISLKSIEFVECWLHSVRFIDVDLSEAKFHGCNLKCAEFDRCILNETVWGNCAVCSIAWRDCSADNVHTTALEAYGAEIKDAASFVSYARNNSKNEPSDHKT